MPRLCCQPPPPPPRRPIGEGPARRPLGRHRRAGRPTAQGPVLRRQQHRTFGGGGGDGPGAEGGCAGRGQGVASMRRPPGSRRRPAAGILLGPRHTREDPHDHTPAWSRGSCHVTRHTQGHATRPTRGGTRDSTRDARRHARGGRGPHAVAGPPTRARGQDLPLIPGRIRGANQRFAGANQRFARGAKICSSDSGRIRGEICRGESGALEGVGPSEAVEEVLPAHPLDAGIRIEGARALCKR